MSTEDRPRYRIRAVAQRTGVPAATLRAWERRYGIPRPVRTEAAYRTYSERDVQQVERLRQLCDSGLSPSDAASLLKAEPHAATPLPRGQVLDEGFDENANGPKTRAQDVQTHALASQTAGSLPASAALASAREVRASSTNADVHRQAVARLLAAAQRMDLESMDKELIQCRSLGSGGQIYDQVLRPTLQGIGQLWHNGEISIGHEHIASEMIHATARDLLRLSQPSHGARVALLACFADELHSGALYGIGFRLLDWGCRVATLGPLTPPSGLAPAVRKLKPKLVGLSVTIAPNPARARELVEGYAMACRGTPWVVGGRGVSAISDLVRECGGRVAERDADIATVLEEVFQSQDRDPPHQR